MSETTQLVLVGVVIAAAGLYVLRAAWKTCFTSAAETGCGAGCGKCAAPASEPKSNPDGRFPLPQL